VDWHTVFGNNHPVELEVGFGKGLFLIHQSEVNPDVNFVGVEIIRKYQLFTANRLARRERRNVRVICDDARSFLRLCVAENSISVLHVYFPDPWWKTRGASLPLNLPNEPGRSSSREADFPSPRMCRPITKWYRE
jgi:tRNA (guanine-N7-)-methyltransferase